MSFPDLTPTSTQSAITLPVTSSDSDTVIKESLAIGFYTGSAAFLLGAKAQVAFTYKRLGGDILDIELTAQNIYNHYEEAVLEYSYIVNLHQARNSLGSALGGATGSFNSKGELEEGEGIELKYPKFVFDYAFRVADKFSTESIAGGTEPIYSASFATVENQQDYNLQTVVKEAAEAGGVDFAHIDTNKRIKIRQVYYVTPRQMWRFYGYYGGLNVVGDFHNYGQYADDSTFQVIPTFQNKLQAIMYEDHLYTRTSHYSYEIIDNKIRIYPIPSRVSPVNFFFRFSVEDNNAFATGSYDSGIFGVNNMNTLPMENIAFKNINSIGQQWIRRFSLALSKETLGHVRGKFGNKVPIPGDSVQLNASELLTQAKEEQNNLREELNKQLDEMLYSKLAEVDKAMTDNTNAIVAKSPYKIYVG